MKPIFDMYAGLAGLELDRDSFELGEGIVLSKTYAHLMAPFMMAFKAPPEYDQPHPGPWKSCGGGFAFDIDAELLIPAALDGKFGPQMEVARMIVFLFRLGVHPAIRLPVFANHPFSTMAGIPDREAWLRPHEFQPRFFSLDTDRNAICAAEVEWIRNRWKTVLNLTRQSPEFSLAVEAIDSGQFVQKTALVLISLWAALEALFSPSTSELKFRVSALIAAYLESPGDARLGLQREVAKLYDKRSAAAHGKPKHESADLLATFNLLARVIRKMIDEGTVPSKESLEQTLFGAAPQT